MKKYIIVALLGGLCLVSCGTQKQGTKAKVQKQTVSKKKSRQSSLSYEQQRQFDYYFSEAVRMRELGEHTTAFEMYQHCLNIQPNAGQVLYDMANYYLFLKQKDKAEYCYKKATESEPENYWYKVTLGNFYENISKVDKAIDVYENLYKTSPQRSEILMELYSLYNKNNDTYNSIRILNEVEKIEGKSEQLIMEKVRLYTKQNEPQKALNEVVALQKEYPNDSRYKVMLAETYTNAGERDKALNIYKSILAEDSNNALARLSLADYYQHIGKDTLYEQQVDTILTLRSVDSDTKLNMLRQVIVKTENTKSDTTYVLNQFRKALANTDLINGDIPMLAVQYMMMKEMKEKDVTPMLNKILSIEPDNSPARLQLLSYAMQKEDYGKIASICTLGNEYNPDVVAFYLYGGLAYSQMDKDKEALDMLKRGIDHIDDKTDDKMSSDLYSILGDVYHEMGKYTECYEAYDKSIKYNAENTGSLNNYAYYLSLRKEQLDKAEEMSYKTIKQQPENFTFLDTYAWILFVKEKYTEAKIYIDQAIKFGGDAHSGIVEHQGDIYYKCGDKEKAVELWKKADSQGCDSKTLKKKIRLKKYIE